MIICWIRNVEISQFYNESVEFYWQRYNTTPAKILAKHASQLAITILKQVVKTKIERFFEPKTRLANVKSITSIVVDNNIGLRTIMKSIPSKAIGKAIGLATNFSDLWFSDDKTFAYPTWTKELLLQCPMVFTTQTCYKLIPNSSRLNWILLETMDTFILLHTLGVTPAKVTWKSLKS